MHRIAAAIQLPLSLLLGTGIVLVACAPVARPAQGPLAEQVLAAIDGGSATFDHADFSELLAGGVRDGLVDYPFFESRRADLESYLDRLGNANLASLTGPQLMALLINAYNAYTIQSILDHPDVTSIKEIAGVWDKRVHRVGGFDLTLDNMEHNLLRPYFKDPRIHVAVNCASQSCAPLPNWAFDGDELEAQLERWTRDFFGNPKYLRVEDDTLLVSRLLEWYGSDFTEADWAPRADSLAAFVSLYAPADVAEFIAAEDGDPDVEFLPYDWALNQVAEQPAS